MNNTTVGWGNKGDSCSLPSWAIWSPEEEVPTIWELYHDKTKIPKKKTQLDTFLVLVLKLKSNLRQQNMLNTMSTVEIYCKATLDVYFS